MPLASLYDRLFAVVLFLLPAWLYAVFLLLSPGVRAANASAELKPHDQFNLWSNDMPTTNGLARGTITAALMEARACVGDLLNNGPALEAIESAAMVMSSILRGGGRIYSCGNGGSMSDAMHFAEELTGRFRETRRGFAAQAISDVGHITCVANDFGYDQIFSRYLESHGRKGDCLLAISTSGSSANVIRAAETARSQGLKVIALTGRTGTVLEALSTVCIVTPGGKFADRIQELHIKVIHILLELIELQFSRP